MAIAGGTPSPSEEREVFTANAPTSKATPTLSNATCIRPILRLNEDMLRSLSCHFVKPRLYIGRFITASRSRISADHRKKPAKNQHKNVVLRPRGRFLVISLQLSK
jgi:hypothetical protein